MGTARQQRVLMAAALKKPQAPINISQIRFLRQSPTGPPVYH